jgi:hypothetical protein
MPPLGDHTQYCSGPEHGFTGTHHSDEPKKFAMLDRRVHLNGM